MLTKTELCSTHILTFNTLSEHIFKIKRASNNVNTLGYIIYRAYVNIPKAKIWIWVFIIPF